jgi:cation diffusion facilitator family transporter
MKNKSRSFYAYLEAWTSISLNTVLFILKYWAGIVTGSVALIADAWHTISDTLSSIIILAGFKITSKPPDSKHPFGHGRAEIITALFIGVILAVIAFNFFMESVSRLQNKVAADYGTIAFIVTIISIISKEGLAQLAFRIGNKIESTVLSAEGWHHRSDAISSVLILVGIILGKYYWWIDGVLGIIMSGLILYATYEVLHDAINPLIGERPDAKLINDIRSICEEITHLSSDVHHIHMHRYGEHTEVTFHIRMPGNVNLEDAHNIATKIEKRIRTELKIEATIHMEPHFVDHK